MNCPKCGKPLPGGASFCMHCGQMLAGGVPRPVQAPAGMQGYAPVTAVALPDSVRKRNTWLAVAVAGVLILLLFFGLKAGGVLKFGAKAPEIPTLNARGETNGNLLQSTGKGTNPTLQSSKITMPDDLYNWLKHLERCEKKKQALTGSQMRELKQLQAQLQGAGGMTTPQDVDNLSDPDYNSFPTIDKAVAAFNEFQPDWEALKKEFDSVPPPQECKPVAEAYDTGLQNMIDIFASVSKIVESTHINDAGDIKKSADDARKVGLHHSRGIDGEFQETDDLVQSICDKYQTRKWFKIDAHGGTGGLFGF
jgi:hypothetical protein